MKANSCQNELDWSAFCYAAGEMTADEAAAFEARLADDQGAREALARAVELTQVVATAESLVPVTLARPQSGKWRAANWSKRLAWMAIGSAASLLVALAWSGSSSWFAGGSVGMPGAVASPDGAELAAAWSQTRQELAESDSELWYPRHVAAMESGTLDAVDLSPLSGIAGDAELLDAVTPEWMTAAVETYPNEPADPDSTPFDGERSEN
jgi:anti-sigma factor RsiW